MPTCVLAVAGRAGLLRVKMGAPACVTLTPGRSLPVHTEYPRAQGSGLLRGGAPAQRLSLTCLSWEDVWASL